MKTYTVRYGGKEGRVQELKESENMIVVRTKGNRNLEDTPLRPETREMLENGTEVLKFPEAGVTVHEMPDQRAEGTPISMRDMARGELKTEDEIRFAGRVLQDAASGQPVLYTENFFVQFEEDTPEETCKSILERYQLRVKSQLAFADKAYFVQAAEGTGLGVFDIAEKLLQEPEVEYCHPELVQERRHKGIHPMQWHLAETSIRGNKIRAHVDVETAWKTTKGKGITIAIIDDGVDIAHPEFAGKVVHPYDATLNTSDPRPKRNDEKHGTACAGMACGSGLDKGASGTAPEAQLMPIRLNSGLGSMSEANAFAWAADHGADVISCSWGPVDGDWWDLNDPAHQQYVPLPDSTRMAIEYALRKGRNGKGSVVLFAAGNGNESVDKDGYASHPGVIAVAACNDNSKRCVYSDYGDAVWISFPSSDFGHREFSHPSPQTEGVRTTDRLGAYGYSAGGDYTNSFGGTSAACPGAAGVVALMLAANPNLTQKQVKNILKEATDQIDKDNGDYDNAGHSPLYGYGRVDAGKAIKAAVGASQTTPVQPTTPGLIRGQIQFNGTELSLETDKLTGDHFNPAKRVLGFNLSLSPSLNGLKLVCQANIPGIGIDKTEGNGQFTGSTDGRRRIIGFTIALAGPGHERYVVEYAAQLKGVYETAKGKNGEWCGTSKKSGKTVEAISVSLRRV